MLDNVSFWGEDRHFCIRARALNIDLFVDTVFPAYHIYRKELLAGVDWYLKNGFDPNSSVYKMVTKANIIKKYKDIKTHCVTSLKNIKKKIIEFNRIYWANRRKQGGGVTLTLSMVVRNESGRYLELVLNHALRYVDKFVIIDDMSTDNTVEIIKKILKDTNYVLIENKKSLFNNEIKLRKLQWRETVKTNPDWILFLDADEIFEDGIIEAKKYLLSNNSVDAYCFRIFDMWDEFHYRNDKYWNAHTRYYPLLIRYQPGFHYVFKNTKQHCGRMPKNVLTLPYANSFFRLKHLGWMREEDRKLKYARYMELDPHGKFGNLDQYKSILDDNPVLVKFD